MIFVEKRLVLRSESDESARAKWCGKVRKLILRVSVRHRGLPEAAWMLVAGFLHG